MLEEPPVFDRLGHLTYSRRYWVLALAGLFLVVGGVWGTGVFGAMISSGFEDPSSESAAALERVQDTVGRDEADVVVLYRDRDGASVDRPGFRAAVEDDLAGLSASLVTGVTTTWSAGPGGAALVSEDGRSTYAVVHVVGDDEDARMEAYEALEPSLRDAPVGLVVRLGGGEAIASDITTQVGEDIARAEMISLPIVLVLLVIVFGGLTAASLPLAVGGLAITRVLHHAAAALAGDRRLHLCGEHRHDARTRPGDRLCALRHQPVP